MNTTFPLKNAALLMALAAVYPLQAHALAGVAQFTAGDVTVRQTDGRITALTKGGDIDSGHAIVTGPNGRAQVKFTDGGLVSLQPNTEFKIANYVDQNDPKQDRFLVDLLRGSMRAITGLIGKRNRNNYKLTTTTATIGIRGSGFKVGYNADGTLGITSELDKIEVCNQSGCIGLVAGESVKVVDSTTPPVRTSEQPKTETPDAPKDPNASGEKVKESGKAEVVVAVTPAPKTTTTAATTTTTATATATKTVTTDPKTGTFADMRGVSHYHTVLSSADQVGTFAASTSNGSATLSAGKLTEISIGGSTFKVGTATLGDSLGTIANGDFIGWGNWASGTKEISGTPSNIFQGHYVVGQPTSVLPTTGNVFATYSLVGHTAPTNYLGTSGTLTTATFLVNFDPTQSGGRILQFNATTSFGTVAENFVYFSSSSFSSTSGNLVGIFTGANALRAGVVYNGTVSTGTVGGSFTGTAVFLKP